LLGLSAEKVFEVMLNSKSASPDYQTYSAMIAATKLEATLKRRPPPSPKRRWPWSRRVKSSPPEDADEHKYALTIVEYLTKARESLDAHFAAEGHSKHLMKQSLLIHNNAIDALAECYESEAALQVFEDLQVR